jgi:hypothetical protein
MNRRKKDKRTNNALQNTTQKEKKKIEKHEPLKNGDLRRCSGRMVVPAPLVAPHMLLLVLYVKQCP